MPLHFSREEFAAREQAVRERMSEAGLDALLLFAQESMYWLTGYDTFGFCFFQCLVFKADGGMALLTRSADLRQAQLTATIEDIRIWTDTGGARPAEQLRDLIADLGLSGKQLGIETDTHGLTYANGRAVFDALEGKATLVEASGLVPALRTIKSPAEIAYIRRAAELADAALDAGLAEIRPGADESAVLAAMQGAVFAGGGDYPGNEFIIGSGDHALLCRYQSGRRILGNRDQITLEWAGSYRHYHAAMMWTVCVGAASDRHRQMFEAAQEALLACEATMVPGRTFGDVFEAHAQVMTAHGMADHMLNACGYGLGARFTPSWMDGPMFYRGNEAVIAENMVLFAHMILMDSETETAMTLGRTSRVTATGPECLSRRPLDLLVATA